MQTTFTFEAIGTLRSCFTEKFGIPRQPGLAAAAQATLEILPPFDQDEAFNGLDAFSHLWLVFVFHGIPTGRWQPTVRPPRLGGNRRIGVFATRSGFRPNPIGISAVVLESIRRENGKMQLILSGIDLLDGTPVLDIKPYLPYADSIPGAGGGFAASPPVSSLRVAFSDSARQACSALEHTYPGFGELLIQVLRADPRPAYLADRSDRTDFGLQLYGVNVRWSIRGEVVTVHSIDGVSARVDR